ncbi:hypothetical protein E3V55_03770 [Candidatus Marinimicrobia bacterium MT.SAG.3]|nr:hypothetical protein E3V55_03770 [Candidatus Marinimicrobia bacterium MT.SAG.3]
MQLSEPMTMITDYLLGGWTFYLAFKLIRKGMRASQRSIILWGLSFVATGIAALIGGTSHGFALYFGTVTKAVIWTATLISIGFASLFLLSAAIITTFKKPLRDWLIAATALKFVLFAIWIVSHSEFKYVIYDYVPAMIGVLILKLYGKYSHGDKSATWIISGILVSFGAAAVQQSGFTLHEHFNHNDLYHVIQMGAIYILYKGGILLLDAGRDFLREQE